MRQPSGASEASSTVVLLPEAAFTPRLVSSATQRSWIYSVPERWFGCSEIALVLFHNAKRVSESRRFVRFIEVETIPLV